MPEPNVIDIDIDRLHVEWVDQPKQYHEAAVALADAKKDVAEAEAQLDLIEAELANAVRLTPSAFGLEKLTVDIVKDRVRVAPERVKALHDLNVKQHRADMAKALVDALSHRKTALENLVSLRLADYFSAPREPKHSGAGMNQPSFGPSNRKSQRSVE
jgi:hypothetical protein